MSLTHSNTVSDSEPGWSGWLSTNRSKLPDSAFADRGGRGFPHHWVRNGSGSDSDGRWTDGDMFLHKGGLNAAWSDAQGARSGKEASESIKSHLQKHRKSLGLNTEPSEFITMEGPSRVFSTVRDFVAFVREQEEDTFFPLLARTILDGKRAQIHKRGDIVTIYDDRGDEITATYKSLLGEFLENKWPHDLIIEGTIMGWSGSNGHLSGDFISLPEHSRAKSFSFVISDAKLMGGMDVIELEAFMRLFALHRWFPANGGFLFKMPNFAGAGWIFQLGMAIEMLNLGPGFKGIEFEHNESGTKVHLVDPIIEFALGDVEPVKSSFNFDFTVNTVKQDIDVSNFKIIPHFQRPTDETPDFVFIEGPAFPHGRLIDGLGQKFEYPIAEVAKAKLSSQVRGRSIPFVNYSHVDDETMIAGQILKLTWLPTQVFKFKDHTGRDVEGAGMLFHKSIITDTKAIWNLMRGNIRAISVEPMFDIDEGDREWPTITNMAITGLALTNHPAIGDAVINKICMEDGECIRVVES